MLHGWAAKATARATERVLLLFGHFSLIGGEAAEAHTAFLSFLIHLLLPLAKVSMAALQPYG